MLTVTTAVKMDFDNMTTSMPTEMVTEVTSGMTTPFVEIQAVPFPMFITRMIQVLAWFGKIVLYICELK